MKKANNFIKIFLFLFLIVLSISVFVGCGDNNSTNNETDDPVVNPTDNPQDNPADDPTNNPTDNPADDPADDPTNNPNDNPVDDPQDNPTDNPQDDPNTQPVVTESFKKLQEAIYKLTLINIPTLTDVEVSEDAILNVEEGKIKGGLNLDKDLFKSLYDYLKEEIHKVSSFKEEDEKCIEEANNANWSFVIQVNGKKKLICVEILFNEEENNSLYINVLASDYYNISVKTLEGGNVLITRNGKLVSSGSLEAINDEIIELLANSSEGYNFIGWYIGDELLSSNAKYSYLVNKADALIVAKFEEIKPNINDDFIKFRSKLNDNSGILLPLFENVSIKNEVVNLDNANQLEIQGDLVFIDKELITQSFNDIKAAISQKLGNPINDNNTTALSLVWVITNYDSEAPHQVEVELFASLDNSLINIKWIKSPIVIINVESKGPGTAYGVYFDGANNEVKYTKYYGFVNSLYGTLYIDKEDGIVFDGWFVNNQLVSTDEKFVFNYSITNFTEITFVAEFSEKANEEVQMTESYKSGREAIYSLTGIYIPELANITLLASSDISPNKGVVCFDIPADKALYTSLYNHLKEEVHKLSNFNKDDESFDEKEKYANWNYLVANDNQKRLVWIGIIFDDENQTNTKVYINVTSSDYYKITVTSTTGGTATLKKDGNVINGNVIETFYDEKLTLEATPNNGYNFIGWYKGNELLSNNSSYVYEVEKSDVQIEARFEENKTNMTSSYQSGRNSFHDISNIWLPELEGVELLNTSSFDVAKKDARFKISSTSASYTAIINALKSEMTQYPSANNNNHLELDFYIFWEWDYLDQGRMHKVTIWAENNNTEIEVGYLFRDFYTITLKKTAGGNVTLKVSGNAMENNTAHLCYNTSCDLYSEASSGYKFVGWFIGDTLLSENAIYNGYMLVSDVDITAKFEEIPSNMSESYKSFRNSLNELSGVLLPAFENVNANNTYINPDNTNHVRDEAEAELVLPSNEGLNQAFLDIKAAFTAVFGDPESDQANQYMIFTQWSIPHYDALIPYRDEVMMNAEPNGTSINVMWRKQPIVIINVASSGPGEAVGVYIGENYEEVPYTKYFEIVDAFHGTLKATPNDGKVFLGWYFGDELLSQDAKYIFDYKNVDFTEITFVGKFGDAPNQQANTTESYSDASGKFEDVTGSTLPEIDNLEVSGAYVSGENQGISIDMTGGTNLTYGSFQTIYSSFVQSFGEATSNEGDENEHAVVWKNSNFILQLNWNPSLSAKISIYEVNLLDFSVAKTNLYGVLGITLPDLDNVKMYGDSTFNNETKEMTCDLCGTGCTYQAFEQLITLFASTLGAWSNGFPQGSENDGYADIQWTTQEGVWVQIFWQSGEMFINSYKMNN